MNDTTVQALTELARARQAELDERIAAWRTAAGIRLWCGPGCGNCCTLTVNATLPEALAIAAAGLDDDLCRRLDATVAALLGHARQCGDARAFLAGYRQAVGPCPFLDGTGNCRIYPRRPLACRALLATRPPDWCGVNLAELPAFERDAFLAGLDRTAVAFPTHYAAAPQSMAGDFERGLVLAMIRHLGFGVTGSLPLLAWLAGRREELSAALAAGPEACSAFLAAHGAHSPFLVQLHIP